MNDRMTFTEALSKMIMKSIDGNPEWELTVVGRMDATEALQRASQKDKSRGAAL